MTAGPVGRRSFATVDVTGVERELARLAALVVLAVVAITLVLPGLLALAATAGA